MYVTIVYADHYSAYIHALLPQKVHSLGFEPGNKAYAY